VVRSELAAPPGADPWGDADLTVPPTAAGNERRRTTAAGISAWLDAMVASTSPITDRLAWFWHGHFTSAIADVKNPQFLVDQIRLFRAFGRGEFGGLVRAVTVDAAMLRYLNGDDSTGDSPNENYSRELLELFTLGVGNYAEADVQAGAKALSGWRVRRTAGVATLVSQRHDDSAQHYLGRDGVHDVDSVVEALRAHRALPPFIAGALAELLVGPACPGDVVGDAVEVFTASGLQVDALVESLLDAVADGVDGGGVQLAPVPWLVAARRATGAAPPSAAVLQQLLAAGQVPWMPPNVSGWPPGPAWANASTLVARLELARMIAGATPEGSPTLVATDLDVLALDLGLEAAFGATTTAALTQVDDPRERLALALVSPEFVTA
jgi:uncharacterized protein (DUF1800 family)